MSEQINQIRGTLSRNERKQLLALACSADRVAWAHACRPAPPSSPATQITNAIFRYVEPFTHLLPGKVGRLIRGASFLTNLSRQFGWFGR